MQQVDNRSYIIRLYYFLKLDNDFYSRIYGLMCFLPFGLCMILTLVLYNTSGGINPTKENALLHVKDIVANPENCFGVLCYKGILVLNITNTDAFCIYNDVESNKYISKTGVANYMNNNYKIDQTIKGSYEPDKEKSYIIKCELFEVDKGPFPFYDAAYYIAITLAIITAIVIIVYSVLFVIFTCSKTLDTHLNQTITTSI
jgi:hypothetical protein